MRCGRAGLIPPEVMTPVTTPHLTGSATSNAATEAPAHALWKGKPPQNTTIPVHSKSISRTIYLVITFELKFYFSISSWTFMFCYRNLNAFLHYTAHFPVPTRGHIIQNTYYFKILLHGVCWTHIVFNYHYDTQWYLGSQTQFSL